MYPPTFQSVLLLKVQRSLLGAPCLHPPQVPLFRDLAPAPPHFSPRQCTPELFQIEVGARRGKGAQEAGRPLAKDLALSRRRGRTPLGVGLRFWVSLPQDCRKRPAQGSRDSLSSLAIHQSHHQPPTPHPGVQVRSGELQLLGAATVWQAGAGCLGDI